MFGFVSCLNTDGQIFVGSTTIKQSIIGNLKLSKEYKNNQVELAQTPSSVSYK